ncbi:MAG: DNA polymerase III subunit gamma/tau [Victivallaceae bacterium]|nr:DNA polymerase III subunit gamma/tau [Victivallaceae bacterium]
MSEYQVIARKWRPRTFGDVVGQEHVLRTLKNAIKANRTAHAYLFVGPRGVGKTTTARIFAKALNCTNLQDGEPCGECPSCVAINQDASLDVIEIDAASHNSADYMRELSEEVMHLPIAGKYKIYIIDEVHMLSKAAWNALLKTVEEPPAHVKFIFATTEAHAVLPTIVSRCQRFDLQPIPSNLIHDRLAKIAAAEKISISDGALQAISRAAAGGMRDAQSLLDQIIAFFGGADGTEIDEETVLSMFALTAGNELEALVSALLANDPASLVRGVSALARRGRNLETLFEDILSTLRGIELVMLLKDQAAEVLDEDPEAIGRFVRLAGMSDQTTVRLLLETLSSVGRILRDAVNKQIFLETIMLKAMRQAHAVRLDDVLMKLKNLRAAGELEYLDKVPPGRPQSAVAAMPMPEPVKKTAVEPAALKTTPAEPAPEPVEKTVVEPAKAVARPAVPAKTGVTGKSASETASAVEKEKVQMSGSDGAALWGKLAEMAGNEFGPAWKERFDGATVSGFEDDTLKIELPFDPAAPVPTDEVRTVESRLIALMQNLTGNWASALRLEYPESDGGGGELIKPEAEKSLPSAIDAAEPAVGMVDTGNADVAADEAASGDDSDGDGEDECVPEADSEMTALNQEDISPSLFNDPDEYRKAQDDPAVRMLRDKFGGEIVDIHRL